MPSFTSDSKGTESSNYNMTNSSFAKSSNENSLIIRKENKHEEEKENNSEN